VGWGAGWVIWEAATAAIMLVVQISRVDSDLKGSLMDRECSRLS